MVKINKVCTRVGDNGRTVLGDGARLPKFHTRVSAVDTVDEANASIGLARLHVSAETKPLLQRIQGRGSVARTLCLPKPLTGH